MGVFTKPRFSCSSSHTVTAECVSSVCLPAPFVWVSLLTFKWLYFPSLLKHTLQAQQQPYSVLMVIYYQLSSSQQPVTSASKLPSYSLLHFSVSLSASQIPAAVFSPAEWGWKGACLFLSPNISQTGGEWVNLYGCDKPRFLPQQHSKPMWQSLVCAARGNTFLGKLSTSVC